MRGHMHTEDVHRRICPGTRRNTGSVECGPLVIAPERSVDQNAPRMLTTTGTVFASSCRSVHTDQFWM